MASILGALSLDTGASSLTAIDGDVVFNDDICLVTTDDGFYVYQLVSPSTETEDSPTVIAPTTNGTTKRWLLRPGRYFNENVELDKDNYLKIREIKEKDTDGIIFTLTDDTEIMRIDSNGLTLSEDLTITNDNLNISSLNSVALTEFIKADGSVGFSDQVTGVNPISDDDLTTKWYVDTQITSAVSPVDLSDYIQFTNVTPFSPSADYQPATVKYVNDTVTLSGAMLTSVYDIDENGVVDVATLAAEASTLTGQGSLATLSQITSAHIDAGIATVDYVLASDGGGGVIWSEQAAAGISGDMTKAVYDTNSDGTVDAADLATVASTITSQGLLATQSEITSGYINSGTAASGEVMVADGASGVTWSPTVAVADLATVATNITGQGSLATLSEVTSAYISSSIAPSGQVLVSDGMAGVEWEEKADVGANADITSMTGLDDDGIPGIKVTGALFKSLAITDLTDAVSPSVLTTAETTNTLISNYKSSGADHVFTMPAAHINGNVMFIIGDEFQVDIQPLTGTNFFLNGTAMASNENIQNTADTLGETIVGYCANINGMLTWMFNSSFANFVEETP